MSNKNFRASVALAAWLCVAGAAQAAITVYDTEASFLAAVSAAGTDTFDDLDYTTTVNGPLTRTAGAHSYTAEAGPTSNFFPASDNGLDVFLATNNRSDTITASGFSAGVSAVGGFFFGTDVNGMLTTATELTVSATDASGITTVPLLNPGAATFRGFISTGGLTSLTLWVGAVQGSGELGVFPALNNLTLAVAVPEPQTWALMLGGLALLGWAARRRQPG